MTKLVAALAATSFLGMAIAAEAQSYTWDLSSEYTVSSLPGRTNAFFAERVHELSGGEIMIVVHYSSALGYGAADHLNAVEDGALVMASTPFNRMNGIDPLFEFQSLPFLQSTIDEAATLDQLLRPIYNDKLQENGQFILFTTTWTPQGLWSNQAVADPSGLEGLRTRVVDRAAAETLAAAGADPIQMSWSDTLPAISTGSINSVLTSDDGGLSANFPDLGLNHFSAVGFTVGVEMIHMNLEEFASLTDELRTALLIAAAEAEAWGWNEARATLARNFASMTDKGVTLVDQPSDELKAHLAQAAQASIDNWKERYGSHADHLEALYRAAKSGN